MDVVATSWTWDTTLIVLIGAVILAPVVVRVAQRRFDPFEPIVLFAVAYGVMFVIRPAAMIVEDSIVFPGPRDSLDVSSTFTRMLLLALTGAVGCVVGYHIPVRRLVGVRDRARVEPNWRAIVAGAVVAGLFGLTSFTLLLGSSRGVHFVETIYRTDDTNLLATGSAAMYAWALFLLLIPVSLVLLAVALDRRNRVLLAGALVPATLLVALASPLGSRITLLPLVGGIFALYYIRRNARPSFRSIAILAVIALFASAFLSDLRGRATRDETVVETLIRSSSPSRFVHMITGPDTEMAPALAAALAVIPEKLGHTYGTTVVGDLVTRPVPRSLWDGKPQIPRKKLIATIWPVEYQRGSLNPEFSALLYFYWDFGFPGVFLGLVLYGALFRALYDYFLTRPNHLHAEVFGALAIWFVVIGVRDSPVDTLVLVTFVLLPVWGILAIARTVERRSRATPLRVARVGRER